MKDFIIDSEGNEVYALETPIVEPIDPLIVQVWQNGTIFINSHIPCESTHNIQLNKAAQIKKSIEELTTLKNRVEDLEDFYDKISLEQSHKIQLLNHSFKLDYTEGE